VAFEDAPPSLPGGPDFSETVAVDGYFLKWMRYFAGDEKVRFAPLLVGRLTHLPHLESETGLSSLRTVTWSFVILGSCFLYFALRWICLLRRARTPIQVRSLKESPNEVLDPEAFAHWAESMGEPDEPGPERDDSEPS